jgi:outer membrane lipoprotein-sorting protein
MKKTKLILLLLLGALSLFAQKPTASDILKAIDRNMTSKTMKSTTRMVVHSRRASRTVESINFSRGSDSFFSEYISPPREKGTKMLKLGTDLWIFDPGTDRSVQISGNMLKQSVMGSDLSYEDFMEESKLEQDYNAVVSGDITHDKRDCWVLTLTAKKDQVAYHSRKIYVDKQRNVALYEEWYAKSGKLLKTIKASNVENISGRWYPRYIHFKDNLKVGKGTEYHIDKIEFDLVIPDYTFSKAMLKK